MGFINKIHIFCFGFRITTKKRLKILKKKIIEKRIWKKNALYEMRLYLKFLPGRCRVHFVIDKKKTKNKKKTWDVNLKLCLIIFTSSSRVCLTSTTRSSPCELYNRILSNGIYRRQSSCDNYVWNILSVCPHPNLFQRKVVCRTRLIRLFISFAVSCD